MVYNIEHVRKFYKDRYVGLSNSDLVERINNDILSLRSPIAYAVKQQGGMGAKNPFVWANYVLLKIFVLAAKGDGFISYDKNGDYSFCYTYLRNLESVSYIVSSPEQFTSYCTTYASEIHIKEIESLCAYLSTQDICTILALMYYAGMPKIKSENDLTTEKFKKQVSKFTSNMVALANRFLKNK